ncbi:Leucine Rich repeat-containing domain protein [Paragonimus heterotremus]|uniref:Leucine Rich repeat-containing domain protein n=1 Tax=Paragonimus heterotremus TaxID=100268 RepID=A0A8J4WGY4_9TREM|nr:Leucine Rich repeat-containing domain protein [Paragonimus heterotremus]
MGPGAGITSQFRCLADDALARLTSLNLQAYWPWLTDTGLLSLGKRLGRVNLAALIAAAITTGNSVAPFNLLRRLEAEEMPQRRLRPRQLAARVRTLSAGTTDVGLMGSESDDAQSLSAQCSDHANLQPDSRCVSQVPDSPQCNSPTECDPHRTSDLSADLLEAYKLAFPPCRLRRLDMSWCGNYSQISPSAFGVFLGDSCRHLVTLRLSSCKFLNDDCLLHVVNNCPHLQELDLSSCTGITAHGFLTLSRLIHLNWLSLYRTHITDDGLLSVSELCQHLQHVNLGSCVDVQDMDLVLEHLTRNNPGLRSLNLWRCTTLSATGIEHIAVSCPLLEELDVGWCLTIAPTQEANNCIVRLVQHCGCIRQLHLTGTSLLNSEELVLVGRRLGNQLEQLNIRGFHHVTSSAVALLLNHCPRLRLLDISFCAQVQLHSVIQLRQLFPFCTIISAIRDLTADVFDTTVHQVIVDEVVDDLENPFAFLQGIFVPPALPGRPELLALPAPNPLPAIAGPPAN